MEIYSVPYFAHLLNTQKGCLAAGFEAKPRETENPATGKKILKIPVQTGHSHFANQIHPSPPPHHKARI